MFSLQLLTHDVFFYLATVSLHSKHSASPSKVVTTQILVFCCILKAWHSKSSFSFYGTYELTTVCEREEEGNTGGLLKHSQLETCSL